MKSLHENLLVRFSLVSFMVLAAIATVLIIGISAKVKQNAINEVVDEAIGATSSKILTTITAADLETPMTGERYDKFHKFVQTSLVSDRTARIKLWGTDGTVIYSSDPTGVGQRFPDKRNLLRALRGDTAIEISVPREADNAGEHGLGTLLEVYSPLIFPGADKPQGAYEIYQYYGPTEQRINDLRLWIIGSIGGGFLVLYILLVYIIWGGWRTISGQRRQLQAVNTDLEDKVEKRTSELFISSEEQRRLANENDALANIGRIITSSLDIDEVYERFAEEVRKLITSDRISITTVDIGNQTLNHSHVSGVSVSGSTSGETHPLAGTVLEMMMQSRSGLVVGEEKIGEISNQFPNLAAGFTMGLRSMIAVPLISNNNVIGVLHLRSWAPNLYSEDDLRLVNRIGDQIASAIANARLYEERKQVEEALRKSEDEQRQLAEENAVIAEIGRIINSSLDIDAVYERFAQLVGPLVPFDNMGVGLIDLDAQTITSAYATGESVPGRGTDDAAPISGTFALAIAESGSSLIFHPSTKNEVEGSFTHLVPYYDAGMRSFMAVPLMVNNQIIGTLQLLSKAENAYTDKHRQFIESVGAQISGAVANAQLYEETQAAKEAAETASRAKSEFMANVSHEIRTPLNGIIGMIHLMNASEVTSQQQNYLRMMDTASRSLLDVINDILDISKVEAGKLELASTEFDLFDLVNSLTDLLALRAQEKGLELMCDFHSDLPRAVVGDPVRLRQIFMNLVGNAIKFTQSGQVKIWGEVESQNDRDMSYHFVVTDTGMGIPREKQDTIFDAFSQADNSTTRDFGGTGLGLSISAQLTQLMGGRIWLESEEGRGSQFHFTVRLILQKTTTTTARWSSGGEQSSTAHWQPGKPLNVLLAEDNRINQALVVMMLENWGHHVMVANNGEEVLALLEGEQADIILMDVQMPRMDGIEATKAIRNKEQGTGNHIPIIAITANAMAGDRERFLSAGMDEYIAKPIGEGVLFEIIRGISDSGTVGCQPDAHTEQPTENVADLDAALATLGGIRGRLNVMASIFLEDSPKYMSGLREAVESRDADLISRTAHKIKGAVRIFAAMRASELAQRLVDMGEVGDLTEVEDVCTALEMEFEQLKIVLSPVAQQQSDE